MSDSVGRQLGPYRITKKIAKGGMAEIYEGVDEVHNRPVAIKVLRADMAEEQEFVTRFRREAEAVAQLKHPNILEVYDSGFEDETEYITMTYVDGGSLKDLISRGPMSPEEAVSIAIQLADALDYAHQEGIVHRDVKPSNVLLAPDGTPLLTDFGIAKSFDETQHLTRTGRSIGTPQYMAPEQIQGDPVDHRTDVYALGIVLYEMVTGRVPFDATTPAAALYKQINEPPPPISEAKVEIPGWLEDIIQKAIAKNPADRYQRAADLAAALRDRRAPEHVPTPPPMPTGSTRVEKERAAMFPVLVAVIVLLILTLLVVAAYLVFSSSGLPSM